MMEAVVQLSVSVWNLVLGVGDNFPITYEVCSTYSKLILHIIICHRTRIAHDHQKAQVCAAAIASSKIRPTICFFFFRNEFWYVCTLYPECYHKKHIFNKLFLFFKLIVFAKWSKTESNRLYITILYCTAPYYTVLRSTAPY